MGPTSANNLVAAIAMAAFPAWLALAPRSVTRFYQWFNPTRQLPSWYPRAARWSGVVLLLFVVLIFAGVLR